MSTSSQRRLVSSPDAATRLSEATAWLGAQGRASEVILVGATPDAVADLARTAGRALAGTFGWHRFTFAQLAWTLAEPVLAGRGLVPVSPLALEALSVRVVHAARAKGTLGRFSRIGDRPGLPSALARTFSALRLEGILPEGMSEKNLAALFDDYTRELAAAKLADRADVLVAATGAVRAGHALVGRPLLFLDVAIASAREHELAAALAASTARVLVTVPAGDERTRGYLRRIEDIAIEERSPRATSALTRMQAGLFEVAPADVASPGGVDVFSSPGESRECVEIARMLQREAASGTPFDRMAIVLRSPQQYRAHLEEALRRAGIPAAFARGTTGPDPSGRAFLALLASAAEGLSASRFAEYLSIGEVPDVTPAGAPPPPTPRWVPADDEIVRSKEPEARAPEDVAPLAVNSSVVDGTLRTPWLWERLLVDAAVIGGIDRWRRRLEGLANELLLASDDHDEPDDPRAARLLRDRRALEGLRAYALPLLSDLAALPTSATWGAWLEKLEALATRALRDPDRVLAVLAELGPMSDVGPVGLAEVRAVLSPRLLEITKRSPPRRYGRVFVAGTSDVRGMAFDVVFVPGLAEKIFPQRISEDPILPDHARGQTSLPINADRRTLERLALRLAVGAATRRVVISYPRLDQAESRPRTPSFYGLEVLRAAEGVLPGFDELALRSNVGAAAQLGWPAPVDPKSAIDHAEHDLALLRTVLGRPESETIGTARYLLSSNAHLARALRFRAQRWGLRKWTAADGLVTPAPEAAGALQKHDLSARSYSPTGLQHYAACPYRFFLQAIHRLAPRQAPEQIETLDPLERGSLIHEAQFSLFGVLRDRNLLPVTPANLSTAQSHLETVLDEIVVRYEDRLYPAIPRVWDDAVAGIRADVREWLRHASQDGSWTPAYFELAFGLDERSGRDPNSQLAPATLESGIQLRGSIDLVERRSAEDGGGLRATDHKTGKVRAESGVVIGGGKVLQPVLYALALERVLPGEASTAGRLYYCTSVGEFTEVTVPLDDRARDAAKLVADTVHGAIASAFLPAAPAKGECEYCDYRVVCGPHEEERTKGKNPDALAPLETLRSAR